MTVTVIEMDDTTAKQMRGLRRLNIIAGFAHLTQMILILVLATDFTLPITVAYTEGPPGTPPSPQVDLVNVSIAWGVAAHFLHQLSQRHCFHLIPKLLHL